MTSEPIPSLPLTPPADPGADLVRWLFPVYIFLILLGFFALRFPGVMPAGNEINHDRAVFHSVNAATLTGFQLAIHPTEFFMPGKIILLVLLLAGTVFTLTVGGMAVKRVLRFSWSDKRILSAVLMIEAFVLIAGAFSSSEFSGEKILGRMFQAAAAFANCGLYIDSPPGVIDRYTHLFLLPLSVIGGLGITVLIELFDAAVHRRKLSRHARVVLELTALFFVIGFAGSVLMQMIDLEAMGQQKGEAWPVAFARLLPRILVNASVASVNTRSAGFSILPPTSFGRGMGFFLMMLMAMGASPGGTGGGLKTTTFSVLFGGIRSALSGRAVSRTFGIAAVWCGIYIAGVCFFQMLLLSTEPQMPGDRLLFITVSAMSNVGLSHDVVTMTRSSLLLVSAAMFVGRVTPLLILWWMADTVHDADIAVG